MKPITIIVSTAPISNINPVVPNKPILAFAESVFSDFLINIATTMAVKKRITSITRNAVRKGIMANGSIALMSGVKPESDDKSPFHVGKIVYRKSDSMVKTAKTNANPATTTPTIPAMVPYRKLLNIPASL